MGILVQSDNLHLEDFILLDVLNFKPDESERAISSSTTK